MRYGKVDYPIVRTLIATAIAACFAPMVFALPVAPNVTNGNASFVQNGNTLTVTNSNRAIINWGSFSIGRGETVTFDQSRSSSVLNRVVGITVGGRLVTNPTEIFGVLNSAGTVFLINPAGILVGQGARIDVAGFVASTLSLSDGDFLTNRLRFSETPGAGKVQNFGDITTPSGGNVYLIAPQVENHGIITAPNGEVLLAAGQRVELIDTATPGVKVEIVGSEGNATNLGTITAEAGRIGIAGVLVKNSGSLNASSLVSEGGRIFLKATTDTLVDGNSQITATGSKGGRIEVLGNRVAVMDNAQLDASGQTAGGTVLVGGDYQGKNTDIQNSQITYFGPQASIKADASDNGNGGKVIVWSDDTTRGYGTISARGGANGGNGGFVEVSGKKSLAFDARVDTSAPFGLTGTLLLDPFSVTIYDGPATAIGGPTWTESGGASILQWSTIDSQLQSTNVTITTTNSGGVGDDIVFSNTYGPMVASGSSTYALALDANDKIIFNQTLDLKGALNAVAGTGIDFNADVKSMSSIFARAKTNNITQNTSKTIKTPSLTAIVDTGSGYIQLSGKNQVDAVDLKTATGDITYNTDLSSTTHVTAASTSGNILVTGDTNSTEIALNTLTTSGTVSVTAQKAILDDNGDGVANITAGSTITLTSLNGTVNPGELAISADIDTPGTVTASVSGGANGSIIIRDVGTTAAGVVGINASAATTEGDTVYFRYGDLNLTTNITLTPKAGVGASGIGATGDINVMAAYTLTGAKTYLSADGDLNVLAIVTMAGADNYIAAGGNMNLTGGGITMNGASSNTVVAGNMLYITGGNTLQSGATKPLDVFAGAVTLDTSATLLAGGDMMLVTPGDINILGGSTLTSTSGTLTFLADNMNVTSGSVSAGLGIDGTLFGGLTLGALAVGSGTMTAANGIVDLAIGGAGIDMYNGSFISSIDATQPEGGLIKIFFAGISSGGSMIDGVATFDGGYKVNNSFTTLGVGLDVTYGVLSNPVSDALVDAFDKTTDSAGGTSETLDSLELATTTTLGIGGTQDTGGTDGNFGNEEAPADGSGSTTGNNQGGTNAKKKPAQCSA